MPDTAASELWDQWIEEYWSKRNDGIPAPIANDELNEMIQWSPHLGAVFPQVVEKICVSTKSKKLKPGFVFSDLRKKGLATKHPNSTTKLLLFLLPRCSEPFDCKNTEELVHELININAPREHLLKICDELARFSCRDAAELRRLIQ